MSFRRLSGYGTTVMLSCAAGWFISATQGAPASASAASPAPCARPGAAHVDGASALVPAPLIAITSDGIATLRVEQQPLEWVLEEIANQSSWSDIKERARAPAWSATTRPAAPADRAEGQAITPERLEQLRQLESERIGAGTADEADP